MIVMSAIYCCVHTHMQHHQDNTGVDEDEVCK